jgi:hypothetical protein
VLESTVAGWMALTVDRTITPVTRFDYDGRGLNYLDGFNSWLGSGRVNAMNPLVPSGQILAPPSPRLQDDVVDVFAVRFGLQDPDPENIKSFLSPREGVLEELPNLEPTAETICGFQPPDDPALIADSGRVQVTVGPVYEGVPFINVEDPESGDVETIIPDPGLISNPENPWDATGFLFVWSDSQPTTTTAEGIIKNPEGRYLADNTRVQNDNSIQFVCAGGAREAGFGATTGRQRLESQELRVIRDEGSIELVPIYGEITIQHELGTQSASSDPDPGRENPGDPTTLITEIDRLLFTIVGDAVVASQPLVITGDSTAEGEVKAPLRTATFRLEGQGGDDNRLFPFWDTSQGAFRPQRTHDELVYRTYRGFLGFVQPSSISQQKTFQARLEFQPNASFLPSYDLDLPETPQGFYFGRIPIQGDTPKQDPVLRLDYGGWRLLDMRLFTIANSFSATYYPLALTLAQNSSAPDWAVSGRELQFVGESGLPSTTSAIIAGTRLPASRNNAFYPNPNTPITAHSNEIRDIAMHPFLPILAVAKGPSGTDPGGVFLMTEDGLNETPIDLSRTAGATGIQWSRTGVVLAVTGHDWIRSVTFPNFEAYQLGPEAASQAIIRDVLPSGGGRLSDISDPAFDASSGFVLVSARLDGAPVKNIFAYLRVAGLPYPNINAPTPLLPGWTQFNQLDLETDAAGERLLFAANRTDSGAISTDYTIYSLRNFNGVLFGGDEPVFQTVDLLTNEAVSSFRSPRLSPDELAVAYVGNPDANGRGVVAWSIAMLEDKVDPGATPAPTPIPSPTGSPVPPTPTPDDRITFTGEIDFDVPQGWVFGTANDLNPAVGTTTGGALTIRSNESGPGNNNTFGFFTSPARTLVPQRNTIYLYRAILRGSAATRAAQPTIRLRANSDDFQLAYETEINSLGSLSEVPGSSPTAVDLLIEPPAAFFELPADLQNFRLSFDLLNFLDDDDPQGGASLERVEVYALKPGAVKQSTFEYFSALDREDERALWDFGTSPEIPGAIRVDSPSGLAMSVNRADRAFGFFTSRPGVVAVGDLDASPVILRMKGRVTTTVSTASSLNPDIRIRMNTGDFQRSSSALVTGNGTGNITPQPGDPALMTTYLVLRSRPLSLPMFLSFDVYAFSRPGISDKPIILDEVQLESIDIPAYPRF